MIVKTEAIVLKSMKWGETSRIVTLYTREFGKLSIIAKGARGAKAKFGAALDVMSRSDLVVYRKEHHDLHLLSQADLIRQYRGIIDDPARLMAGFAILEFLHVTVQGEEEHQELFELLARALDDLDAHDEDAHLVLLRFLLGLASVLGVGFDMEHCVSCRAPLDRTNIVREYAAFSTGYGGCTCAGCTQKPDSLQISRKALFLLQQLHAGADAATVLDGSAHTVTQEAVHLLNKHLAAHIEGMRSVKSMKMLDAFGPPPPSPIPLSALSPTPLQVGRGEKNRDRRSEE